MGKRKITIPTADTAWHEAFLRVLRECPVVSYAAQTVKVSRSIAYTHRQQSLEFAAAWDDAIAEGSEMLELKALRRAEAMSDTLMIFLLKAYNPAKFRDQIKVESTSLNVNWEDLTDAELAQIAAGANPASVLANRSK